MNMATSADRPKLGTYILERTILSCTPSTKQSQLRIAYRIIRPSLLNSEHAPLLFIHGGPSLSSEYLDPIANEVSLSCRSLIFYDQLGCGWSSIPQRSEWYGVENMALDLKELLKHLKKEHNLSRYHMCCHSLGGAIGYQMLKDTHDEDSKNMPQCMSLILSNASTNFKLSESERRRLFKQFEDTQAGFFLTHICRCKEIPRVLELALSRRGKEWSANEYVALPLKCNTDKFPPTLIVRGEYDFVTEICTHGWKDLLGNEVQEVVMNDCAHYMHLERPNDYCQVLQDFCKSNE